MGVLTMAPSKKKQVTGFARIVRESFLNVKNDINSFKRSMDDWIFYLNDNQIDLKKRVAVLENRIAQLEKAQAKEERWIRV